MKKLRFLSATLCVCMALALLPSAALAASGTHNGLDISLTTDKSKYAPGETITAVVTVENTNRFSAHNCSVKLELPDGLTLEDGTAGVAPLKLIIGCTDTATFKLAIQETMTVPKTGGGLQTGLWILLSIAAAGALLVLVVKRKRLSGSLLCVMLCAAMLLAAPTAVLAASKSFSVTETITVNGRQYPITATLYYELDDRTREVEPDLHD